jgi:hypothetical protein
MALQQTEAAEPAHSEPVTHTGHHARLSALVLGALGVVFGDIGTSPLYTLKECLLSAGGADVSRADLFGILSLMFWALIMVVTVKYLYSIMRADHHGEGGIFALNCQFPLVHQTEGWPRRESNVPRDHTHNRWTSFPARRPGAGPVRVLPGGFTSPAVLVPDPSPRPYADSPGRAKTTSPGRGPANMLSSRPAHARAASRSHAPAC